MEGGVQGQTPWIPRHGRAVQVDPVKPKLKPPGTKRLKLKGDVLFSSVAFKYDLRRYATEEAAAQAGTSTRPLLRSTQAVLFSLPFCI